MESTNALTLLFTTLVLFLCFTTPIFSASSSSSSSVPKAYTNFIKTSCNSTTYPSLCNKSLSPYASSIKTNSLKLCYTALTLTIKAARNTSSMVSKLAKQKGITRIEAAAIKDCIANMQDSVYELKQSLQALSKLKGDDKEFQMANAKTWVSAAITDEDTCMDGFTGRKVNAAVKNKIKNGILVVMSLSSNALSLINKLEY
ncbi:hypothetical protein LguiA_023960 [Lonicera macranthoides]